MCQLFLLMYCVAHCLMCREAAEQRIEELQILLKEAFKQITTDYDEEDEGQLSDEVSEL